MTTVYDAVWAEFVQGDHISAMPRRKGFSLALIVWVQHPAIVDRIAEIQREFHGRIPFASTPLDALHITVRNLGPLIEPAPESLAGPPLAPLEAAPDQLLQRTHRPLVEHLRLVLSGIPPFSIRLARINSFFVCPFIETHDGETIQRIRDALAPGLDELGLADYDYGTLGFVPHLTLGLYTESNDGAAARQMATKLREREIGALWVDRLTLARADLSARADKSAQVCCLKTIAEFQLTAADR